MKSEHSPQEKTLFSHPFSRAYWRAASGEMAKLRMLLLAALIIAVRVALKNVRIPVGDSLYIYIGFIFAAVGGSVYGPVVGFFSGIISDLLGVIIAPVGAFNPVYTLIEAAAGLLYGVFTYRQKITFGRVLATKATVNIFINILCTSVANGIVVGKGVYYYMIPSILKNLVLLPFEVLVLSVIFLGLIRPMISLRLYKPEQNALKLEKSSYILLAVVWVLILIAATLIVLNYPACKEAFKAFFDSIFQK